MLAFFVYFNAAIVQSSVKFRDVSEMYDGDEQTGYYDIDYKLNGEPIPFSLLNIGTEFKLMVDNQAYYPKLYERGPFGGLDIELYMDKITEDDFAVHYRITNKGNKTVTFQLGTYTDVSFRRLSNGDLNNINVLDDKRIFYVNCTDIIKDPWQKLVFDQRPPDSDRLQYIPPDHHWFGLLPENADKYNMKFKNDSENKDFADPAGINEDVSVSHSWNSIDIGVNETVVLGNRIYFLMKTPFELNPEKKVVYSEPKREISLPTWIRILEHGKTYHPQIKLHSDPESSWKDDRGKSFTCKKNHENWKFVVNQQQQGEYVYDLRLVQDNPHLVSNVETVTLKVSTKPSLSIATQSDHNINKVYKNDESIGFTATIRGDTELRLKYVVTKIGKNNVRIKVFEKLSEPYHLDNSAKDQTFNAQFSLQEAKIRSGTYKLEITAINKFDFPSDTKTIDFKTDFATKIIKYEFKPKSYVNPKSKVKLVGTFIEEDIQQVITFHLDLNDGSAKHDSKPYQAQGKEQEFSIEFNAPNTEKLYNCQLTATDETGTQFFKQTIDLRVSRGPKVTYEPNSISSTLSMNDTIKIKLTVEDETKGGFYYSLNGGVKHLISNYSVNQQNISSTEFTFNLAENNITYRSSEYSLQLFAIDEFGQESQPKKFDFGVLSKPLLKRVDLPNTSNPFNPVVFNITFDDLDLGKNLILYIKYDGNTDKVDGIISNGKQDQVHEISHKFVQPGNYLVTFMLSSLDKSPEVGPENSRSNEIPNKSILLTNVPKVKCALADNRINYFGSGETFEIIFTVLDDKNGIINYYIDNNMVFSDDANVIKEYSVPNGQEYINVKTNITIPRSLVYNDNEQHRLKICVTDNFNLSSDPCNIYFKIRSMPRATGIELNTTKVYRDIEHPEIKPNINITFSYYNDDANKPLSFYIKENSTSGSETLLGTLRNPAVGHNSTSFVYTVMTKSYKDLELIFWIEDDENPAEDDRNGESNMISKYINVTYIPIYDCECFDERFFGKNSIINLSGQLKDDTSGKLKFRIVDKDQKTRLDMDKPYNATTTNENSLMELGAEIPIPNDLDLNMEYNLIFYPINEFGVANEPKICPFTYKSKPIFRDLKLSTDKPVDNDQKVNITGTLIDYDNGKTINIYQQIGLYSPVKLGSIESDGTEHNFSYELQGLLELSSGNTSVEIIATDTTLEDSSEETTAVGIVYLNMQNDPDVIVKFPEEKNYKIGDSFKYTINISADLAGVIYIYDSVLNHKKGRNIDTINYTHSQILEKTFNIEEGNGGKDLYIMVYGPSGSHAGPFKFSYNILKPPELNNFQIKSAVGTPGKKIIFRYEFNKSDSQIFFLYRINGQIKSLGNIKNSKFWYKEHNYNVPLNASLGQLRIDGWIQYSNHEIPQRYTKSKEFTVNLPISQEPTVDFNFPIDRDEYGYDDPITLSFEIQEKTGSFNCEIKFGQTSVRKIDDVRANKLIRLNDIKIPKEIIFKSNKPKVKCTITVKNEYNLTTTGYHYFILRSKPIISQLEEIDKSNSQYFPGESFQVKCRFTDKTLPQYLYWYYKFDGDEKYQPIKGFNIKNENPVILTVSIPQDTKPGRHIIYVMMSSRKNLDVKKTYNSDSEPKTTSIEVVKKPNLTIDAFQNSFYSTGGDLRVTGNIEGNDYYQIEVYISNKNIKNITGVYQNGKTSTAIDETIHLPNNMDYGENRIEFRPYTKNRQGRAISKTINIKNKPKLLSVKSDFDVYLRGHEIFMGSASFIDYDNTKPLFIYGQLPNQAPIKLYSEQLNSDGSEQTIYLYAETQFPNDMPLGETKMTIWVTDMEDPTKGDDVDKSNTIDVTFKLTDLPSIKVKFPNTHCHTSNETIQAAITVNDDNYVTVKVQIDYNEIDEYDERIVSNSVETTVSKSISLNNLKYGEHLISILVRDHLNYSSDIESYSFQIVNKPIINNVQFERSYALLNEVIDFNLTYSDYDDTKPLYIYLQLRDRDIKKSIHSLRSNGKTNQEITIGLLIDKNEEAGTYPLKIWISNSDQPFDRSRLIKQSDVFETTLVIAYRPTLEIRQPNKQNYSDGEKIPIIGTITSFSNLILKYRIDDKPINETSEITVSEKTMDFNTYFKIPVDYKYGPHKLNVQGFDINGESTSNTDIKFNIQNPPKILSISLERDRIQPGHTLRFSGVVRDPDLNNNLRFVGRIDSAADEIVHRMVADSFEQEFSFEYKVDSDIEIGEHEFIVKVVDNDELSSLPASVSFTVYKAIKDETEGGNEEGNNNDPSLNKEIKTKKKSSFDGLIAGIVIVGIILVVLIIVAVIMFMRSRGGSAPMEQESVSDHSDLEEKETEIMTASTITADEIATNDNPLFSSTEINHDGDPFSDEFEEQQA